MKAKKKQQLRFGKGYYRELAEPILIPLVSTLSQKSESELNSDEKMRLLDDYIEQQRQRKFRLLMEIYGIDISKGHCGAELAFNLANDFVEGFSFSINLPNGKGVGRPPDETMKLLMKQIQEELARRPPNGGISERAMCKLFANKNNKNSKTVHRRYMEHKKNIQQGK